MVLKSPALEASAEAPVQCRPCEGGTPPLSKEKIDKSMAQYRGWQLLEDKKLVKEFKFRDFREAKYFLDLVSIVADEQAHHPALTLIFNKLKITLTTHAAGGLTENDFIMAKIIDELEG
ncbi:MAG: 4a-hydroxytetrahydrobiopterin dehydratase [Candidatus Omnitrophota bacterium]|nr:4a-hydroxytetrahydrobiopterin dehydratase [Candidatus Omnitrophota bacterium]